jgi:hypothetical protein
MSWGRNIPSTVDIGCPTYEIRGLWAPEPRDAWLASVMFLSHTMRHPMPTQILNLSSADLKKAAALQARIEELQSKLVELIGAGGAPHPVPASQGRGKMSEAQRAKLSRAAKARWKKAKAAGKTTL